jgi:diaminopimelate epimerase
MKPGLPFVKMHGAGNDFVLVDALKKPVKIGAGLARALCDRRFGVGADQILLIEPSKKADFRMRVTNADGSEVEMCGNGIRCAALYAAERGRVKKAAMSVETLAGIIRPALAGKAGGAARVRVDMGEPVLEAEKIPTAAKGRVIDHPLRFDGHEASVTCVSMGNPHCVIFTDDLDKAPVESWGPVIERLPFFPKRTNVEFVQVENPGAARVRVWERGAGLTLACGTGACAVGVAGVLTGRLRRDVELALPGGALRIEWAPDNRVFMTGPAAFVFDGVFKG